MLAAGAGALWWMVRHVGVDAVLAGLRRIGAGFALVCAAHLGSLLADAWLMRILTGPAASFLVYVRVTLAGHALNQVVAQLGELTKYSLFREHMGSERAASALVVKNLAMFVAFAVLLVAAPALAAISLDLEPTVRIAMWVGAGVAAVAAAVAIAILRAGVGRWMFVLARRLGVGAERIARGQQWLETVETNWRQLSRTPRIMALSALAALLRVACHVTEIGVILTLVGWRDGLVVVPLLAFANAQLVQWLVPVPVSTGTGEAGAFLLFSALGIPPGLGVLVELTRKLRAIVFISLGLLLLGWSALWHQRGRRV